MLAEQALEATPMASAVPHTPANSLSLDVCELSCFLSLYQKPPTHFRRLDSDPHGSLVLQANTFGKRGSRKWE